MKQPYSQGPLCREEERGRPGNEVTLNLVTLGIMLDGTFPCKIFD